LGLELQIATADTFWGEIRVIKPCALVIGLWEWKRAWFGRFIPECNPVYLDEQADLLTIRETASQYNAERFYIWGFSEPEGTLELAQEWGIDVWRVEDGFLRSTGLTGDRCPALSLCFDSRGLYFNAQIPSDLEVLLSSLPFQYASDLLAEAKVCRTRLLELNLSKYNHTGQRDSTPLYGLKTRERILVVGQVEDDMSIQFGYGKPFTNNDLVRLAHAENPTAEIIYKPHPDVLAGHRARHSDPREVAGIAKITTERLRIGDALQTIDRVYTLTSLVGFESLLRGIPVTVVGSPFYAGWGLTDDRADHPRRNRRLTIDELFAVAYLLYPRYVHPETERPISAGIAMDLLAHGAI
jgi:capsule polysaccharide export protein KpsC/LpsZ